MRKYTALLTLLAGACAGAEKTGAALDAAVPGMMAGPPPTAGDPSSSADARAATGMGSDAPPTVEDASSTSGAKDGPGSPGPKDGQVSKDGPAMASGDAPAASGDAGGGGPPAGGYCRPATSCGDPAVAFCDGFDDAAGFGAWTPTRKYSPSNPGKTHILELDTNMKCRGASALHVRVFPGALATGNDPSDALVGIPYPTAKLSASRFYGRMFFYMSSQTIAHHMTVMLADGPGGGGLPWITNFLGDTMAVRIKEAGHGANSYDTAANRGTLMPPKRWNCIEWLWDGAQGATSFFLNGSATSTVNTTGWAPAVFNKIQLGYESPHGDPLYKDTGIDLWFDDFAMSDKRIGCQ